MVPTKVADDLRPDSALITRIQKKRVTSQKVQYTSFVGGSDNIIIPRIYAADSDSYMIVPHTGHVGLLFSPTVFKIIAQKLSA